MKTDGGVASVVTLPVTGHPTVTKSACAATAAVKMVTAAVKMVTGWSRISAA
jgi:hypothetical protein